MGTYPEVGIAEVGKLAAAMRTALAEGKDPLEEKAKVEEAPKVPTFKDAAETLHKDLLPGWKNPKHGQQWLNTLIEYVFPKLGQKLLPDIQPGDVAEVLKPIWLTKAETASRVKQRIHAVMAWGCHPLAGTATWQSCAHTAPPRYAMARHTDIRAAAPQDGQPA
jgi:integrase